MTRYSNTMSEILAGIRGKNLHEAPEDKMPASPDEGSMADQQLEFIAYAAEEIKQHIANGGEFPEWMQNKLAKVNGEMQSLHANINHENVQDQKEETIIESHFKVGDEVKCKASGKTGEVVAVDPEGKGKYYTVKRDDGETMKYAPDELVKESLDEGKSSTGYELYHKDFSSAMQHAYDFAKKKFKITVKPEEIDNKVASGPRKPSKGKTNSYRLEGDKGAIHVQVYGMDNGKYELNMYKESVDLEEARLSDVAKDLAKYAMKSGGIDKNDFMKAAAMMKQGKDRELGKFTMDLDTEPRDKIIDMVKKSVGKSAAEKIFNVTIREEVELTEKLKVSDGLGAWIDDFKKSDAPQFKGKSDEEKKNMAIAAFVDAGGKLEQKEELEEAQKELTPKAVVDYLVKTGVNKKDAEKAVKQSFGYANKKYGGSTYASALKKVAEVIWTLADEVQLGEEGEPQKPDSAKEVEQGREDKKKTRIAQLQLQIAKAQETINKLNAQEKPSE